MTLPPDTTYDTVTGAQWRAATPAERTAFHEQQRRLGIACYVCLSCGFPVAYGGQHCEACEDPDHPMDPADRQRFSVVNARTLATWKPAAISWMRERT